MGQNDTYDKFLKPAINWLVHSDIRNKTRDEVIRGGFNLGYDLRKKSYSLAYCEITGYAISLLVDLYHLEGNRDFLDFAVQAGEFLLGMQYKGENQKISGAFPRGYSFPQKEIVHDLYSFDTAICISALVDLFRETNEQRFLTSAKVAGDWLANQMQYDSGAFRAMYNYQTQDFAQINKWFGDGGCLHAKNAIGLLKLFDATGNPRYKESANKVCDWILKLQKRNGAFKATENESHTFTHAHCYATEGLLYAHLTLNNEKYLHAVKESAKWLIQAQNRDGSLYRHYDKHVLLPTKTTDATAQAARIWIILHYLTGEKDYLDAARKSAKFLVDMQCQENNDPNAYGGLFYQLREFWKLRYVYPVINTWPLIFTMHVLYAFKNVNKKGYEITAILD